MTSEDIEQATLSELIEEFQQQKNINSLEGRRGIEGLGEICKVLGYTSKYGSIIEDFLMDNSGAIEAIIEWIAERDCEDVIENFRNEIVPELDEDADILEILQEVANEIDGTIRDDYSGRNMFGRTCYGIDCSNATLCIEAAARYGLKNAKTDNMGFGWIVYWPDRTKIEEKEESSNPVD